jgi:hypothetical protein
MQKVQRRQCCVSGEFVDIDLGAAALRQIETGFDMGAMMERFSRGSLGIICGNEIHQPFVLVNQA